MNNQQQVLTIDQAMAKAEESKKEKKPMVALQIYNDILNKYPHNLNALFSRGMLLEENKEYKAALKDYNTLIDLSYDVHIVYSKMGDCYSKLMDNDIAVECYIKSMQSKPDYVNTYAPAVSFMERVGRLKDAEKLVDNALKLVPKSSDLHFLKGKIYLKGKDYKRAEKHYAKAVNFGLFERSAHIVLAEYSSVKEKLGKYDEAMGLAVQAQKFASQTKDALNAHTSPLQNTKIIEQSMGWFSKKDIKGWEKADYTGKKAPVFLVGFPRSGTTLMEQILFAHHNLTVTDEVQVLPAKMVYINKVFGREIQYPQDYATITHEEIQKWRDEYFAAMQRTLPHIDHSLRIVDKNPMSFIYMGAIKRFFPESPMLMMIRDPRDVCLSCFFQTFAPNSDTVHFYDLKETATYYAKAMDLYFKFRDTMSMDILEVKYEDMIDDFENHARNIIKFIGEEWDDNVLTYYEQKNSRFIKTPSYEAVKQPVNNKAVGRWQKYEKYFKEITPILQPYLKEFGYD